MRGALRFERAGGRVGLAHRLPATTRRALRRGSHRVTVRTYARSSRRRMAGTSTFPAPASLMAIILDSRALARHPPRYSLRRAQVPLLARLARNIFGRGRGRAERRRCRTIDLGL